MNFFDQPLPKHHYVSEVRPEITAGQCNAVREEAERLLADGKLDSTDIAQLAKAHDMPPYVVRVIFGDVAVLGRAAEFLRRTVSEPNLYNQL